MGFAAEGEIHIPLEEFYNFVQGYIPDSMGEVCFGVPKPTKDGVDLVINFASSNESNPADWSKKPACLLEWEELRKS